MSPALEEASQGASQGAILDAVYSDKAVRNADGAGLLPTERSSVPVAQIWFMYVGSNRAF